MSCALRRLALSTSEKLDALKSHMPHDALERVFLVEVVYCSSTKCLALWRNLGISGDNVQYMDF